MKKVYFFGTGWCAKFYLNKVKLALGALGGFQIVGFLDNDASKAGTQFGGYPVWPPDILKSCPCDLVLLFLVKDENYKTVSRQLSGMVPPGQVCRYDFPLKRLLQKNYGKSNDREIIGALEYISDNQLSYFNQFIKAADTYDEVKWDSRAGLPYIDFVTIEGRKVPMYYPRDYPFIKIDNALYVKNVLWEQSPGSPHAYVKKGHGVEDGDCIIDAGVCEGNFALRYVDLASHLYLFEMDPAWQGPLRYTFRNYEKKVTFIDKAVSDRPSDATCRIDDVVGNKRIDFIKMDIEGAEPSAICGAERTFCKNNIRSSICSYHKNGDEKKIRGRLQKYGYQTTVSNGYMLFLLSDDTWEKGDLRRGVVYGDR